MPRGGYGVHAGLSRAADAEEGDYTYGGHADLNPVDFFGLHASVDYRSQAAFGDAEDLVKAKSVPITLSGRFYLPGPTGRLRPFALAGASWYNVIYDFSEALESRLGVEDRTVRTFGWHLGAGAALHLAERFGVYGEARYAFIDPDKELDDELADEIRNLDYDSATFELGLSILF